MTCMLFPHALRRLTLASGFERFGHGYRTPGTLQSPESLNVNGERACIASLASDTNQAGGFNSRVAKLDLSSWS
jgi:hypothetical protein